MHGSSGGFALPPIESAKLLSARKRADPRARPTIARLEVGLVVPAEPGSIAGTSIAAHPEGSPYLV